MLLDLTEDVVIPIVSTNPATGAALDADSAPDFRIYAETGAIANDTCETLDTGAITNVTAASPAVVTSANHGLVDGMTVVVAGVGGTSGVNGTRTVTVISANTFSLDGTTGVGAYTSGGEWHVPGLYKATLDSDIRDSLEAGKSYTLIAYGLFSAVQKIIGDPVRFTVVS
jgi:hypothetical protein